jgi:GNAT superfamily N-acetyltransferase
MPSADPRLVETWTTGWARARGAHPPERHRDGFRIEVDAPDPHTRYVFPAVSATFLRLANDIHDPGIQLKACAPIATIRALVPARWKLDVPRTMMIRAALDPAPVVLPEGYLLEMSNADGVSTAAIHAPDGSIAASGHAVVVDYAAIYDRIATEEVHRRRGLGRALMAALDLAACDEGARRGLLVATEQGRMLYKALGWRAHAPYTSVSIRPRG